MTIQVKRTPGSSPDGTTFRYQSRCPVLSFCLINFVRMLLVLLEWLEPIQYNEYFTEQLCWIAAFSIASLFMGHQSPAGAVEI